MSSGCEPIRAQHGEGFKRWFNTVKDCPYVSYWFYGMFLIGDGSLCEYPVDCNDNSVHDDSEVPVSCGGMCTEDCDPDCNCNGKPGACDEPRAPDIGVRVFDASQRPM